MRDAPNYYAVLPANIRYADDLSCLQKLLYAEITALSNKDGFCYASNQYFADLYKKDPTWVSKSISDMQKKWYLKLDRENSSWFVRKIFVWELKILKKSIKTTCRKTQKASCRKIQEGIEENCKTGIEENCNIIIQDNNTTSVIGSEPPTAALWSKIEYMNKMRSVEFIGKLYLQAWNDVIGDCAIMSDGVKKWIYNIQASMSAEDFKARVEKFKNIRDLIVDKKAQKYFYYPIRTRTLEEFMKNINKFYWDNSLVISRIYNKDHKNEALRVLETRSTQKQEIKAEPKKEMTEEEKQRSREIMQQAKERLLKCNY